MKVPQRSWNPFKAACRPWLSVVRGANAQDFAIYLVSPAPDLLSQEREVMQDASPTCKWPVVQSIPDRLTCKLPPTAEANMQQRHISEVIPWTGCQSLSLGIEPCLGPAGGAGSSLS